MSPRRVLSGPEDVPHGFNVRVGEIAGAASGGRVPVILNGQTVRLHLLRNYSPTIGDEVLVVVRRSQGYVMGALGTAPRAPRPPEETDTGVPTDAPSGITVFRPVQTDTYREGVGWLGVPDLIQGKLGTGGNNRGVAYYGAGPRGLRGLTATRAYLRLTRLPGGLSRRHPNIRLLPTKTRPPGLPTSAAVWVPPLTVEGSISVGETRVYRLPDAWASEFLAGTAGGLGVWVDPSGASLQYARFEGARATLQINWRR